MNKGVYAALCLAGAAGLAGLTVSCTNSSAADRSTASTTSPVRSSNESATTLPGTPAQRRAAVLKAGGQGADGLPVLAAAMNDSNVMVRRTAIRELGDVGLPAVDLLTAAAQGDADPLVRRTAVRELVRLQGDKAVSILDEAVHDKAPMVRQAAVETLARIEPRTESITKLLQEAQHDSDAGVSKLASSVLWPFHKTAESVRQLPQFKDHQLSVLKTIALPAEGWRFKTDPHQTGQLFKWYASDFDDAGWDMIKIGEAWETQGHGPYDGVAWYRRTIKLPARPDGAVGVDLVFEGVDESAWIWINGQYVGDHDIGVAGWNQPFAADVTDALKWGQDNQITVRVLDRAMAGGIWKPVHLEILGQ